MAAVVSAVEELRTNSPYSRIDEYGTALMGHLRRLADQHGLELRIQGIPVAFHASFGEGEVHDAAFAARLDGARYARFSELLVARGVWVAGRGVWYTSAAHGDTELAAVIDRVDAAMAAFEG